MKHRFLTICFLSLFAGASYATKHTVSSTPDFSFSPFTLNVSVGDTVIFELAGNHNALEVSQTTWNNNGSTALAGGFSTPFGGGQVVIGTAGNHYYVCVPHAGGGMKGVITATAQTGNPGVRKQDTPFTARVINQKLLVTFNNSGSGTVGVFDILGNKLSISPANDPVEISLASFKTGIYFVVLNGDRGRFTQRVFYRKED